eukprot:TRINITY_DN2993_c0_g1_i1.p1 TRINITY_DN2993_c0_g1~~TRINITY_DN2993_c0_g1_i1.p1  ORF type:complete len:192 (-),score=16.16 TRINITY_DN2993_c0_g1_i1:665-1240(-)
MDADDNGPITHSASGADSESEDNSDKQYDDHGSAPGVRYCNPERRPTIFPAVEQRHEGKRLLGSTFSLETDQPPMSSDNQRIAYPVMHPIETYQHLLSSNRTSLPLLINSGAVAAVIRIAAVRACLASVDVSRWFALGNQLANTLQTQWPQPLLPNQIAVICSQYEQDPAFVRHIATEIVRHLRTSGFLRA